MVKYLYIIDYWIPFPQSEYGGMINVIAQDDNECFELLSNPDEDFYQESYVNRILPAIKNAQKLQLATDYKSDIIEAFIT